jgi:hypothetical protein
MAKVQKEEARKVLLIEFVPLENLNLKFGVNTKRNKSENLISNFTKMAMRFTYLENGIKYNNPYDLRVTVP